MSFTPPFNDRNFSSISDATTPETVVLDSSECGISDGNTLTFQIILMMGIVFVIISALISFYIDKVDRKKLLGMCVCVCLQDKKIHRYNGPATNKYGISSIFSGFVLFSLNRFATSVGWLWICSIFAISIALVPQFYVMAISFMIFISCGLCAGIISAISIALFPTHIR